VLERRGKQIGPMPASRRPPAGADGHQGDTSKVVLASASPSSSRGS